MKSLGDNAEDGALFVALTDPGRPGPVSDTRNPLHRELWWRRR